MIYKNNGKWETNYLHPKKNAEIMIYLYENKGFP